MASGGIHFIVETERDGGISIILAYVRKGGPDPGPEYHPVVFDAQGKRHLPKAGEGGSCSSLTVPGVMLHQVKYHLEAADLPGQKGRDSRYRGGAAERRTRLQGICVGDGVRAGQGQGDRAAALAPGRPAMTG